jgi:hypothetical protein
VRITYVDSESPFRLSLHASDRRAIRLPKLISPLPDILLLLRMSLIGMDWRTQ